MRMVVLPGDGIGPEITSATTQVLKAASEHFQLGVQIEEHQVGHQSLRQFGTTVQPRLLEIARAARTYPGLRNPLGDFDLVVVRENTEGFYADRNMEQGNGEILVTSDVVISLRRITRLCCERIAKSACQLAMRRNKHLTVVHKANVLKIGDGMFLDICRETAKGFPGLVVDDILVDAMMAHVVRNPNRFDVIVSTNMFGDILSDLTAELSGSLGLGGSLNVG